MSLVEKLKHMVIEGNLEEIAGTTGEALGAGIDPQRIIDEALIAAMDKVGERFAAGDLFIPEMLLSAKTMESALAVLRPLIAGKGIQAKAKVVFGTVEGDVHDIGKNLVIMMMQGAGFEVQDLGTNVSPENFYQAVQKYRPNLFCMSALLTTTQGAMARTVQYLKEKGVRESVKVMAGGAPITEAFAREIGADGYAPDAGTAVERAKQLLGLG
ncbi:MAG: corrinoid protein [Syntrophaceae bacterium]|nr:corrinoid protein [Syntrophaceae bacterium]